MRAHAPEPELAAALSLAHIRMPGLTQLFTFHVPFRSLSMSPRPTESTRMSRPLAVEHGRKPWDTASDGLCSSNRAVVPEWLMPVVSC